MARITFRNIRKNEHKIFTDAINFVIEKFVPKLDDQLDIEITGIRDLDVDGCCEWIDTNIRPRMFNIDLSLAMDKSKRLRILFHELTHLKQFAKGELVDYMTNRSNGVETLKNTDAAKWHGKKIITKNMDYYDYPWEIEARGRETGLYLQFLEKYPKYQKVVKTSLD